MRIAMKKLLLGAVGLLALATTASAADLPARTYTKAPAMAAAAYDWSGFYIGANGGYGSSRNCWDLYQTFNNPPFVPAFAEGCSKATGAVAGGQIGYRWQAGGLVFGLEAQGDWANLTGSYHSNFNFGFQNTIERTRLDAFGLFTGQVGYAWNNALLYVKGGAALVRNRYDSTLTSGPFDSAQENRWGGVVGVGLEYGFTPNWSFAVEYDRMFMGTHLVSFYDPTGAFTRSDRISQDVDLVTVRLNYRFGGPVVARY
jgi:outer membrane immunogenic protein